MVSTIRNPGVNLLLLKHLKEKGFTGRVALTARTKEDAELYLQANPSVVLRPYLDAAEQGADALAGAWHALSQETDWPVALSENRIKSGSAFAGRSISTIPLRSETGVSIVAVSRAGRVFFNPGPDFQLFPSDRIVIMGPPEDLHRAETMIHRVAKPSSPEDSAGVSLVEIRVTQGSPLAGKILEKTGFRQMYGSTVIGIRYEGEYIISPGPQELLREGCDLLVLASGEHLERLTNDFELSVTGSDLMSEDI